MSRNANRRSFFGSLKDHLRRSSIDISEETPSNYRRTNSSRRQSRASTARSGQAASSVPNIVTDRRSMHATDPDAPPPPYSAVAPAGACLPGQPRRPVSPAPSQTPSRGSGASRLTVQDVTSAEDPYAFLSVFDTVFVIDDSGSMAGRSWREVRAVLSSITPICTAHDADGIDLYFLNHRSPAPAPGPGKAPGGYANVRDIAEVNRIFETVRPSASTPTGTRMNSILRPYLRHYREAAAVDPDEPDCKPVNIIVITDGVPTDDLDSVLYNAAQRLDQLDAPPYQVGVQFFRVGNEPEAEQYLRDLDDNLCKMGAGAGVRDIVDTVTWDRRGAALTADGILKAVLGAVIKRLDRIPTGPAPVSAPPSRGPSPSPSRQSAQFLTVP